LLHHFSYKRHEVLERLLNMPGFETYYSATKKMFPIFFNFFGET
jgi:hypothetical protein